jgi:ribosomal protein L40E
MLKNIFEESIFYLTKAIIYLNDLNLLLSLNEINYNKAIQNFEDNFNLFLEKFKKNINFFNIIFLKDINNDEILKIFQNISDYKNLSLIIFDDNSNFSKGESLSKLNELLNNLSILLNYLNNIFNLLPNNELKSWELILLNSFLTKLDLNYSDYMKFVLNQLIEYYEIFLKIRGDLLGQDLKEITLKVITFLKDIVDSLENKAILNKFKDYINQIKEIDEYIQEIGIKISDYEYYIVSKDMSLIRIPFANVWFEFILYYYWLYENYVSINAFKNLYEYRTKNSFDKVNDWYKIYINRIFNKEEFKKELYQSIINKVNQIKIFMENLYSQVLSNYPNRVEINSNWANLFYDILNSMNKLENEVHIRYDNKELKGTGLFENLYEVIYRVYSEDLSIVYLYNFNVYLNEIINDLQRNENTLITPYDKLILDNVDLFNNFITMINNYFSNYENKDLLVDIWLYFENKIKGILLNILEDYKDIEKLFELKKIVCVKCGFENDYYNEYCSKCNSKLIKPQFETKSNLRSIFDQFKENYLNNLDYSKFLYAFINLINNSFINFDSVYKNLENLPKEGEVILLLEKVESILIILNDIKNNISLFNDVTDESEKQELLQTIENNIQELENLLYDFNNYLNNLRSNVKSI